MHDDFVAFHQLEPTTPFLNITTRRRCVVCGEENGQCRSDPRLEALKAYPVVGSPVEGPQPARRILQARPGTRRITWREIGDDEQIEC